MKKENPGYHLTEINKGVYGQYSKVAEEMEEILDALEQDCAIMVIVEMSDMMGAMEAYYENFADLLTQVSFGWDYGWVPESPDFAADLQTDFECLNAEPDNIEYLYSVLQAVKNYLMRFNMTFVDLQKMNHITKRAFINGRRTVSN